MELREISLDDKRLFENLNYIGSDYIFSSIYMYSKLFKLKIYSDSKTIIIYSDLENPSFFMPLGDTEYGINLVVEYCKQNQMTPYFTKIPRSHIKFFENMNYKIKEDRDSFDYIYSNSNLATYEGSNFRKQRNNISNYLKTNNPIYNDKIYDNIEKCKQFTLKHYAGTDVVEPTLKILDCVEEFNLDGGIVWNGEEMQGYCVYKKVDNNMVISHVELTDNDHRGVHAYMINEMSQRIDTEFINREDDMGLLGLRRFKEMYNPTELFVKYSAYYEN